MSFFYMAFLFVAKLADNMLSTSKTILVQRNKSILAGIALGASTFIYFFLTKYIVADDGLWSTIIVAVASGVGCCFAVELSNKFSKAKTYVNVIMSNDVEAVKKLRDFLAEHKITNVVTDSYTMEWEKAMAITAYAETKEQSRMIDEYINNNDAKFKRFVQNERVRKRNGT